MEQDNIMNLVSLTRCSRGKDKNIEKRVCSWFRLHTPDFRFECKGRGGLMYCEYKNNSIHNHFN